VSTSFTVCGDNVSADVLASVARQGGGQVWQPEGETLKVLGSADAGRPLMVVLGEVDDDRLIAAMQPGVAACVEVAHGQVPDLSRAVLDGLYLNLSTASAYGMEPAHHFCEALAQRVELSEKTSQLMELALHEALVNAMVHGNLEVGPIAKDSLEDFMQFCQLVESRLSDSAYGPRRVVMYARWPGETVDVVIEDQGNGYDPDAVDDVDLTKKSGRGLFLIRDIAREVLVEDRGRRLVMRFER
jgi:anti-sigma regulatory factor (Ser/Thr protein kinase)